MNRLLHEAVDFEEQNNWSLKIRRERRIQNKKMRKLSSFHERAYQTVGYLDTQFSNRFIWFEITLLGYKGGDYLIILTVIYTIVLNTILSIMEFEIIKIMNSLWLKLVDRYGWNRENEIKGIYSYQIIDLETQKKHFF